MVEIQVFIEGAVLDHENHSALTMDNSQRFREGFRKLFSKAFAEEDLKIIVQNGSGIKQTVNFFKQHATAVPSVLLLIDLEAPKTQRNAVLAQYDLSDWQHSVFFMIQAMEAWILSQPDKIEQCFSKLRHGEERIENDNSLRGVHPESILHPESVLNTILSRYFRIVKNGTVKKLKYHGGKLKIAPDLIERLDFNGLRATFEDVDRLYLKITALRINDAEEA